MTRLAAALALSLLLGTAACMATSVPYDRDLYPHWIDADGDCQDTRQEVLIAESRVPVRMTADGCRVVSGEWFDPYTGQVFTDPGRLDIDHLVPLAEAHRSGADQWTEEWREAFANDLDLDESLIAVSASANRSKADQDPAEWLPPRRAYRCEYARAWLAVKDRWGLHIDPEEARAIAHALSDCP